MSAKDFLVELGTEELPPKALKTLSEAFEAGITQGLLDAKLGFDFNKAMEKKLGTGLFNIQTRIKAINGTMEIRTQVGSGTKIIFTINKIK